jgi:glycosyltransferase involved in cell wall biosynthesis
MNFRRDSVPRVSIGMPVYNRPQELRRALTAIVEQTYPHLEIIVSDNASPGDDVEKVVHEFMSRDGRIQYYRQAENYGAEHNFQFVLDKATGDYFMWASDDDWREPGFVEELSALLTAHPESPMAFCNFIAVLETGEPVRHYYPDFYSKMKQFTKSSTSLRRLMFFLQSGIGGKANLFYGLFRRQLLEDFSFETFIRQSGHFAMDMLFVFWILGKGPLALSDKCLYRCTVGNKKFYQDGTGTSWNMRAVLKKSAEYSNYAFRYLLVADRGERLFLGMLLPIKVVLLAGGMIRRRLEKRPF